MSTEYRRGIPGTAHVEAATRLGLLWRGSDEWLHRFRNQNGQIEVWYFEDPNETPDWEAPDFAIEDLDFRPICPDGTPVDWEVLDQEVARGIHAGNARNAPLSNALANFATVLDAVAERRVAERMRGAGACAYRNICASSARALPLRRRATGSAWVAMVAHRGWTRRVGDRCSL